MKTLRDPYFRHAMHYEQVARRANSLYFQGGNAVTVGLDALEMEWPNIRAGQAWAASRSEMDEEAAVLCAAYPEACADCSDVRQNPSEQITWLEAGVVAARRIKDRAKEAAHVGNLGLLYLGMGQLPRAVACFEEQIAVSQEIGNRRQEGIGLGNLGLAYASSNHPTLAQSYYERYRTIAHDIGDARCESEALGNLGVAYHESGDIQRAIEFYTESLTMRRAIGDRRFEATMLSHLGLGYADTGDLRLAVDHYDQALVIYRELGDRRGESSVLINLGLASASSSGNLCRSFDFCQSALDISREIGDVRGERNALVALGDLSPGSEEAQPAIEFYSQALALDRRIGDQRQESQDLDCLARVHVSLREMHRAIECFERALAIVREIGDRQTEGETLTNIGIAYRDWSEEIDLGKLTLSLGRTRAYSNDLFNRIRFQADQTVRVRVHHSVESLKLAVAIYRDSGDREGEGRALAELSISLFQLGDRRSAITTAEMALPILEDVDDPCVSKLRGHVRQWRGGID